MTRNQIPTVNAQKKKISMCETTENHQVTKEDIKRNKRKQTNKQETVRKMAIISIYVSTPYFPL